jgi:hypothetical protein
MNEYSNMNGTYTKLDTSLTLEGTWKTGELVYNGAYAYIVAISDGTFSFTDGGPRAGAKGTYPTGTNTNPAVCTFTDVNLGVYEDRSDDWKTWNDLTQQQKNYVGGSQTITIIIYTDRCEAGPNVFEKQP